MNKIDGGNRKLILVEMGNYADTITAERVKRVINGYGTEKMLLKAISVEILATMNLVNPSFDGEALNASIGLDDIRKYVYFTETQQKLLSHSTLKSLAIWARHMDVAYYFNYEKGNTTTLNRDFLHTIQTKADEYVIYADLCTLSQRELENGHISFKIPTRHQKMYKERWINEN
ncbi:MAG: hypothetical protein ACLUTU_17110 [Blautia faecis]